jgi:cbb3-type cytochrome oxidase subunit 3
MLLMQRLLHATLLRNPEQRGIYHFISYSLLRTQRHRVYLAMYGGLGLALLAVCAVNFRMARGHLGFVLSPDGLRAAVPITAFWMIAGLRTAFLSSTNKSGGWLFRVIMGRPGVTQLQTATLWILPCVLVFTLALAGLIAIMGPAGLSGWRISLIQALVAIGISLLLTDLLFLKVTNLPFTGEGGERNKNLAWILVQYFGLFPPSVLVAISLERWLAIHVWRPVVTVCLIAAAHHVLRRMRRKHAEYYANLIDLDDDEEEFPQRLGLRY